MRSSRLSHEFPRVMLCDKSSANRIRFCEAAAGRKPFMLDTSSCGRTTPTTTHGLLLVQPQLLVGFATPLVDKRVARHTVDQLHVVQLAVVLVLQPLAWSQWCAFGGTNRAQTCACVVEDACGRATQMPWELRHARSFSLASADSKITRSWAICFDTRSFITSYLSRHQQQRISTALHETRWQRGWHDVLRRSCVAVQQTRTHRHTPC